MDRRHMRLKEKIYIEADNNTFAKLNARGSTKFWSFC